MNMFHKSLFPPAMAKESGMCVFVMPGSRQVAVESL